MTDRLIDGKYKVLRPLGAGAMGVVSVAMHVGTGRQVALKLLQAPEMSSSKPVETSWPARFAIEARSIGQLQSPHIVQVLDAGTDGERGAPYLVMELLRGKDFDAWLRATSPLRVDTALRIVAQACRGLVTAHRSGVVHRDIKPANLFLAETPDSDELLVKLVDFGVAKVQHTDASQTVAELTRTGALLGTPQYMSPEQGQGLRSIDHRADIWSLGVVLYRALCGRPPFGLDGGGVGQLLVAISTRPAPPIQDVAPWVPLEVARILHVALQIDPSERQQNAEVLLADLERLCPEGLTLRRPMIVKAESEEQALVATRFLPPPSATQRARARQQRRRLAVGAAAVLAVVAVAMAVPLSRAPPVETPSFVAPPAVGISPPEAQLPVPETTARLLVFPPNATVDIDGRRVEVDEGAIVLRGPMGSTHRVRARALGIETTTDVAITEDGALPAKLVVSTPSAAPLAKKKTKRQAQKPKGLAPRTTFE